MIRFARAICLSVALMGIVACGDGSTAPLAPKTRAAFATLIGEPLTSAVATEVVVQIGITDSAKKAVGSQLVNFVVGDGTLFAASAISNQDGTVFVRWTLGTRAGVQWLEARAIDQTTGDALVLGRITAIATPGAASTILYVSDGVFFMGEHRAVSDVFGIVDRYGNAVKVNADSIGLSAPWTAKGDSIIAPVELTASGKVTIIAAGRTTSVRIFSMPDFRKGTFRLTGSCVGAASDSVTFAGSLASISYSSDRRTLSFLTQYGATRWSKSAPTAGSNTFLSVNALVTPDSIQTKENVGTFTLISASPAVYQSKSATVVSTDCKSSPTWRIAIAQ